LEGCIESAFFLKLTHIHLSLTPIKKEQSNDQSDQNKYTNIFVYYCNGSKKNWKDGR